MNNNTTLAVIIGIVCAMFAAMSWADTQGRAAVKIADLQNVACREVKP